MIRFIAAAVAIVACAATPATAQQSGCGERGRIIASLPDFRMAFIGWMDTGFILELRMTDAGRWAALRTDATGRTCLLATGSSARLFFGETASERRPK